ncbi:protease [Bacteroidia bacterium]|nr:protease [Bacteroidia bacterium]
MKSARKIELLSPAGNVEIGMEAINHGADAVYIGAPRFGARASAGNTLDDICTLTEYAHTYWAKVYVALNTILYDSELPEAEKMIRELYTIGVDALIIQDMGILNLDIPPIPLHASTQCDIRTIEKVRFFENTGFSRVILARELSLNEISDIHKQADIPLEVFVHGSLCTSFSGQCYISHSLTGRSANRGECAQICRLPYSLHDASGKILAQQKHLLSLKDLNQSEHIESLLDAGVSSLKIEGRLKDMAYVKNITAFYRRKLDEIIAKRSEYIHASSGENTAFFVPNPAKSFNRGFTSYFLFGKNQSVLSPETPKSMGEPIGNIKDLNRNFFTMLGKTPIHNGDGLCFLNDKKELEGFRVNRVEGDKIFPAKMPVIDLGTSLFRNQDYEFEKILSKKSAERKIALDFDLVETPFGFSLTATDENDCRVTLVFPFSKEAAQKDQNDNYRQQLSKLGNTPFELKTLRILFKSNPFIPSSVLSEWKRKVIERLLSARKINYFQIKRNIPSENAPYPETSLRYLGNVANQKADVFYRQHGVQSIEPAFELEKQEGVTVMFTKHCILHHLNRCKKTVGDKDYREPLYLLSGNNKFQLRFDCEQCVMKIIYY